MENRASYVTVGTFVVLLMLGLAGFVVWLTKSSFSESIQRYHVYLTGSVTGLLEGSIVRYQGVPVGIVRDIRIAPQDINQIQVLIEVPSETPITEDSIASLELQGITGTAYIQITAGAKDSKPLEPRSYGEIPVIKSKPSTIAAVLDSAPHLVGDLRQLLDRAGKMLNDENQQKVSQILTDATVVSANLRQASGDLSATMTSMRRTADSIDRLTTSIETGWVKPGADAIASLQKTVGIVEVKADQIATDLKRLSSSFASAADNLAGVLKDSRKPLTDFSQRGLYQLSDLAAEMRVLVSTLNRVTTQFERNPARFLIGPGNGGVPAK